MKVVILARVSTDKQEYNRQVVELTDYCSKMGWQIAKVFANKVSGAKTAEERKSDAFNRRLSKRFIELGKRHR